jgi:uncharacterized protein YdaU (DUF1376 family)
MIFYKRYPGDYSRDTVHLSMIEDGAYNRLIDFYYSSEKPLPLDVKKIYRIARAVEKAEQQAVDMVLEEFFALEVDGYHQKRIDAEIVKSIPKASANQSNGKLGGRPPKNKQSENPPDNPNDDAEGEKTKPKNNPQNNPLGSEVETHQKPALVNHSHSHSQINQNQEAAQVASTVDACEQPADASPPRIGEICILLRRKGIITSPAQLQGHTWPTDPACTDDILDAAVDKAKAQKGPNARIPVGYLTPIIVDLLHPPEPKPSAAKPTGDQWWTSNAGIDRKGRELGMFARGTESYNDFKDRIFAKLNQKKEIA